MTGNLFNHMLRLRPSLPQLFGQLRHIVNGWPELRLAATRISYEQWARSHLKRLLTESRVIELPYSASPMFSIIIAAHNKAHFTALCLQSIAAQAWCDVETILVDNGSTDLTFKLLNHVSGLKLIHNAENVGYPRAVNQGVAAARGRYLLLLNNDVVLASDAITAALPVLDRDVRVGAVGCKLILPDGRLQEAGCMIWRDGQCEGFGRGARLDSPRFARPRTVAYCSAAALFVRADAFTTVGGYQEIYSPAYYEDVDLCVSMWRRGYSVWYEPSATAMHFEFGTARDRSTYSSIVERNRKAFVARHRSYLERRPSRPRIALWRRGVLLRHVAKRQN